MGYMLERSLRNQFRKRNLKKEVTCLITQVMVDPRDPAFEKSQQTDRTFLHSIPRCGTEKRKKSGPWLKIVDVDTGALSLPHSRKKIINIDVIKALLAQGMNVIAAGGGGIPAYYDGPR